MEKHRNAYDDDWIIVGGVSVLLLLLFLLGKYMSLT